VGDARYIGKAYWAGDDRAGRLAWAQQEADVSGASRRPVRVKRLVVVVATTGVGCRWGATVAEI
jgi:hypothetical protein